jgi:glycosyltransferase involved in cell wall biosynthesis
LSSAEGSTQADRLPSITVLIPCRNEESYIEACIGSIAANGYPESLLEILVVEGMSRDSTPAILADCATRYPFLRIIEEPGLYAPFVFNAGVRAAQGEIVALISAHSTLEKGYLELCASAMRAHGADVVGGVTKMTARRNDLVARCILHCLGTRFGSGTGYFRFPTAEPRWVDTVFGALYKRELFDTVGMFNEALTRGSDMEFHRRLLGAGKRTLLVPGTTVNYFARSTPSEFFRHTWLNGRWAVLPFAHSKVVPVSFRHLVPTLFVTALIALAALSPWIGWLPLIALAAVYLTCAVAVSVSVAIKEKDPGVAVVLPFVFLGHHVLYGAGGLYGLALVAGRMLKNRGRRSAIPER